MAIRPDENIDIDIYRKPTHTDRYLNFSSNHPLQHKFGVIQTPIYREESVIIDPSAVDEGKQYITQAVVECGCPKRASNRANN